MKQIISFEKEIPFKTMIGEITSISLEHTLAFQDDSTIGGEFIVSGTYKMTEASRLDEKFSYKVPVDIVLTSELEEEDRLVDIDNFTYEILDEEALLIHIDLIVEGREKVEVLEEAHPLEIQTPEIEMLQEEQEKTPTEMEEIEESQQELPQEEEESLQRNAPVEEEEEEKDAQEEAILTTNQEASIEEESLLQAQESLEKMNDNKDSQEKSVEMSNNSPQNTAPSKEVMHSIFSAFKDTEETFSTYSIYILREGDTLDEVLNHYGVSREEAEKYNQLEDLKVGSKLILPTVLLNE